MDAQPPQNQNENIFHRQDEVEAREDIQNAVEDVIINEDCHFEEKMEIFVPSVHQEVEQEDTVVE